MRLSVEDAWYQDAFDIDYERIYWDTNDTAETEVRGILRYLNLEDRSASILDLACGWGRHAIPLARRGHRVIGVDLSQAMLDTAVRYGAEQRVTVRQFDDLPTAIREIRKRPLGARELSVVREDMRTPIPESAFDAIINVFTSFGYFSDEDDDERVLDNAFRALQPGGRFLIDVDNPSQYMTRRQGTQYHTITVDGEPLEVLHEETIDSKRGWRIAHYSIPGERPDEPRREKILQCRLYFREDLVELLAKVGFEVDSQAWGNFRNQKYGNESPRLILTARRPR